jgi:ubiquinone/menaquinone biosynthesis C-methylase UbiE
MHTLERTGSFTVKAISTVKSESDVGPNKSQADEVLREWRQSAFYWQKHADTIRTMFGPITQALIDDSEIIEGDAVLDVAGGAGEPSLTIAKTVGPTGSVVCTDVTAEMVAAAQSEAQRHGVTNIAFRQCGADSLPFENNSFDSVVCRLGVMFFPDPLSGLREMLRVTKHEGRLSLAVWDRAELNPFSYLITDVLARRFGAAKPEEPNAPGAFRFAESGSLSRILRQAGATEIKERPLKFHIAAPISPKEFWEMRSETSGTLREKLATMHAEDREVVGREVQDALREFFPNNQMCLPAQLIIVSGQNQ